jgi:hypothetical protein
MKTKELNGLPTMMTSDCDEFVGTSELEKAIMSPPVRHLKSRKSRGGRGRREEFIVVGVGFVAHSGAERVHCDFEIDQAMGIVEDDFSVSEMDDLNTQVVVLEPGQCEHDIIVDVLKSVVSSSSSGSKSSSSR